MTDVVKKDATAGFAEEKGKRKITKGTYQPRRYTQGPSARPSMWKRLKGV